MVDKRLKAIGLNGTRLARLTGQEPNTVRRKLRGDQGLRLGAREAGIMACLEVMTKEQCDQLEVEFERLLAEFSHFDPHSKS